MGVNRMKALPPPIHQIPFAIKFFWVENIFYDVFVVQHIKTNNVPKQNCVCSISYKVNMC